MKIKTMSYKELIIDRIQTQNKIAKVSGLAKKDLIKHLHNLDNEIGIRRKCRNYD